MPPLHKLPPARLSLSARIWAFVLRAYLVLAAGLILIRILCRCNGRSSASDIVCGRSRGRRLTPPGARPLTAKTIAIKTSMVEAISRDRCRGVSDRIAGKIDMWRIAYKAYWRSQAEAALIMPIVYRTRRPSMTPFGLIRMVYLRIHPILNSWRFPKAYARERRPSPTRYIRAHKKTRWNKGSRYISSIKS
jgi:hypothetical protein